MMPNLPVALGFYGALIGGAVGALFFGVPGAVGLGILGFGCGWELGNGNLP